MASQPVGGGVEPRGAADRPASSTKGDPAWAALHERMDELLAMTRLTSFAFGQQIGMNKSTVSRYFNRQLGGEVRLCKWDLMHKLMAVAENAAGQVLGEDYRLETLRRYHAVAALDARRDLTQVTDLLGQIEHATANLSHAYFEIRRLEAEIERLRGERLSTDRTEQQVRVQHLEAEKWAGVRQALRAQAAASDEQAPTDQWILREPGPNPGPDPQPSCWPKGPGRAAASGQRPGRPTLTVIGLALALVLALTAAVLATVALGKRPTTPQAGPAAGTIPAQLPTTPGQTIVSSANPAPPPTSTAANGVTYQCTGSAPDGIDISYGSEDSEDAPSSLPFFVSEPLQPTQLYGIFAILEGGVGSEVTCTLSVTAAGRTVTDTQTATGSNMVSPEIRYAGGQWIGDD